MKTKKEGNAFLGRYQVGNFILQKYMKHLTKEELKALRADYPRSKERLEVKGRIGFPFIKITTVSGNWEVHYAAGSRMFDMINNTLDNLDDANKKALTSLLIMIYTDTMIMGDGEYWREKGEAISAFVERSSHIENPEMVTEEESKILSMEKGLEESREDIESAAESL